MFRKCTPTPTRTQFRGVVNLNEHLSKMSPSEIIDEMESIFFCDASEEIDPELLDAYLDHLDTISPLRNEDNEIESFDEFWLRNSAIFNTISYTPYKNKTQNSKGGKRIVHRALVAALICILLLAGSVTYACNSKIAQWIESTFSFNDVHQTEYASLQEALDDYHIKDKLVPTWLPAGYAVTDISVHTANAFTMFTAQYSNEADNYITITIKKYLTNGGAVYEKGLELKTISVHGVQYYIMDNYDNTNIVWYKDDFECCISGNIASEDILPIINSID